MCVCVGASSALLGKEGAMACTVAVEESVSEHYNSQIRELMEADPEKYTKLLLVRPTHTHTHLFTHTHSHTHSLTLSHTCTNTPALCVCVCVCRCVCRCVSLTQRDTLSSSPPCESHSSHIDRIYHQSDGPIDPSHMTLA